MRRDVDVVAHRFGATRAVGLSMGAGALLNLIADEPDRFSRVVLLGPASIDEPNEAARGLFLEMAERLGVELPENILQWSLDGSAELIAKRPQWRETITARVMRMNATGVPRALRAYVYGAPPVADASVLKRVTAPVLICAADGDEVHDTAIARRLASLFPNAELRVWPEPLAMFDDPAELARLIGAFLNA
jgi:pimeloyl-ACP methyl ester carboxylesterase